MTLFGYTLQDPAWLLALPLVVAALLWRRIAGRPRLEFAPYTLLAGAVAGRRAPRLRDARWPVLVQALALAAAVVALARPVERIERPREREGIDVVLALDVSSSMRSEDLAPGVDRLATARAAALRFASERPDDRIGLVRFAAFPELLCPPTLDHDALARFLEELEPVREDGPEDQTGIGAAVALGAEVLSRSDAEAQVLVLLTDGEENVASADEPREIGPLRAARLCEAFGVRAYTIAAGVGRPGPPGPGGRPTTVPLDTSAVRAVAERTGGVFFEARDARAVESVFAEIDRLERARFEEPRVVFLDRFFGVLVLAATLWVVGWLWELALGELP